MTTSYDNIVNKQTNAKDYNNQKNETSQKQKNLQIRKDKRKQKSKCLEPQYTQNAGTTMNLQKDGIDVTQLKRVLQDQRMKIDQEKKYNKNWGQRMNQQDENRYRGYERKENSRVWQNKQQKNDNCMQGQRSQMINCQHISSQRQLISQYRNPPRRSQPQPLQKPPQPQYQTNNSSLTTNPQPSGLPNIGNSCFMNAFIQLLFSSTTFRHSLLQYKFYSEQEIRQSKKWIYLFKQLFTLMICQQERYYEKRIILGKMVEVLKAGREEYRMYQQEDSVMFLIEVLGFVSQEDRNLVKEIFQFTYTKICENNQSHDQVIMGQQGTKILFCEKMIDEVSFPSLFDYCPEPVCHGKNMKKNQYVFLDKYPQSLIILKPSTSRQQRLSSQTSTLYYFMIQNLQNPGETEIYLSKYTKKSSILYSGNGHSGHYIAKRKKLENTIFDETEQFYIFDDSRVYESRGNRFDEKAFLYEFGGMRQLIKQRKTSIKNEFQDNERNSREGKQFDDDNCHDQMKSLLLDLIDPHMKLEQMENSQRRKLQGVTIQLTEKLHSIVVWINRKQSTQRQLIVANNESHLERGTNKPSQSSDRPTLKGKDNQMNNKESSMSRNQLIRDKQDVKDDETKQEKKYKGSSWLDPIGKVTGFIKSFWINSPKMPSKSNENKGSISFQNHTQSQSKQVIVKNHNQTDNKFKASRSINLQTMATTTTNKPSGHEDLTLKYPSLSKDSMFKLGINSYTKSSDQPQKQNPKPPANSIINIDQDLQNIQPPLAQVNHNLTNQVNQHHHPSIQTNPTTGTNIFQNNQQNLVNDKSVVQQQGVKLQQGLQQNQNNTGGEGQEQCEEWLCCICKCFQEMLEGWLGGQRDNRGKECGNDEVLDKQGSKVEDEKKDDTNLLEIKLKMAQHNIQNKSPPPPKLQQSNPNSLPDIPQTNHQNEQNPSHPHHNPDTSNNPPHSKQQQNTISDTNNTKPLIETAGRKLRRSQGKQHKNN